MLLSFWKPPFEPSRGLFIGMPPREIKENRVMIAKNFMGFLFALLICAVLILPGRASGAESKPREMRIVTSFYPMQIMAMNVFKGLKNINLTNLTPPTMGCLHDYLLTPDDMRKLEKADVLVANGAGMESFLIKVAGRYPRLRIEELSRGIPLITGSAGPNPHVWVSVSHAIAEVKNLSLYMSRIDAGNASVYLKNAEEYIARLESLRKEMHASLDVYRGTPIITFHEAFPYFAQEFGLRIVDVIEREAGSAPSARELANTIGIIKKHRVKSLFSEPQYPAAAAEAIARETGTRLYLLDPAVTGPVRPDAYINIMRNNLNTLKDALK
jgi:zinc transport system substrate-binding protein